MKFSALLLAFTLSSAPAVSYAKESAKNTPQHVIHTCSTRDSSTYALACNIYKEARGEGLEGQMAIGFVTINRSQHEKFPESVRKVVYQKKQFSWTIYKNGYKIRDREMWEQSLSVAKFMMKIRNNPAAYSFLDNTNGSLYFHTTDIKPYWAKSFKKTVVIGNHQFYKPKETS